MIYFLHDTMLKRLVRKHTAWEHTVRGTENPGAETCRSRTQVLLGQHLNLDRLPYSADVDATASRHPYHTPYQ